MDDTQTAGRVAEILKTITGRADDHMGLPARLCAECLSALDVSGVAIALMTADGPSGVVLAATDARAAQLEEFQFALGEGPCVEASARGRPVLEPTIGPEESARWPRFGATVLAVGVRAIFAFPLRVGGVRVGVLDLYRDVPGQLTEPDSVDALAFADAATVVVLHLQDHHARAAFDNPLEGRAEIHQATGMITVQLGVRVDTALLRLRAHAYATKRTVSAVAADVVNRRFSFDDSATTQLDGS